VVQAAIGAIESGRKHAVEGICPEKVISAGDFYLDVGYGASEGRLEIRSVVRWVDPGKWKKLWIWRNLRLGN